MRISISALSKSFSLSDEALRFYERKGLLAPTRIHDSGYRVFERVDIQRIGNIKRLKNQGFQLDEIRVVYSGISQKDMLKLMDEKLHELSWDIRYKQMIHQRMEECIGLVLRYERQGSWPMFVYDKPYYTALYPSIEALWDSVNDSETLKKLFCHLPLSSFTTLFSHSALSDPDHMDPPQKGVLISADAAALLDIDPSHGFRRIDATSALSCVLALENGQFELNGVADVMLAFLKDKNLQPADDLFTHQIINFPDTDGIHYHYTELVLPVQPN